MLSAYASVDAVYEDRTGWTQSMESAEKVRSQQEILGCDSDYVSLSSGVVPYS